MSALRYTFIYRIKWKGEIWIINLYAFLEPECTCYAFVRLFVTYYTYFTFIIFNFLLREKLHAIYHDGFKLFVILSTISLVKSWHHILIHRCYSFKFYWNIVRTQLLRMLEHSCSGKQHFQFIELWLLLSLSERKN